MERIRAIEDLKRAEEVLRESEKSVRLIVDGIAGLVAIMTPEGEVEFVNNQALEYFGKTLEELKGWAPATPSTQMTSLRRPPPGSTLSKLGIRMTLTTVCAVLMVATAGFTHVAYLCVTLKVALSVGITCLRTLTSGGGLKRSYGGVKLTCPKRRN